MSLLVIALAAGAEVVSWDLETSDGGFSSYGDTAQWAWGEVRHGPGSGADGRNAWGTGLVADYLNDSTDYLELPSVDLSAISRPVLVFSHWYELADGDVGVVEVEVEGEWTAVQPVYGYPSSSGYTGSSAGWETVAVDLSPYGDQPGVRFGFTADASATASGWYIDAVGLYDGDVVPPAILSVTELADTEDYLGPYLVEAEVEDDLAVGSVELRWSVDGGTEVVTTMTSDAAGRWSGLIPGQGPGSEVGYHVIASDLANSRRYPAASELAFRVYLAAPTALTAPSGRVVGSTVPLSWAAPVSAHPPLGYRVYRGEEQVAEVGTTAADAPVTGGVDTFTVRALYEAGEGDPSNPVTVEAAVPTITGLSPGEVWPGGAVRLLVSGEYLLLADGEVSADLGAGVEVLGVEVRDVDHAWISAEVAEDAAQGARDLVLVGAAGSVTGEGLLQVLDAASRPRLLTIEPESLRQGEVAEVELCWAGTLVGAPVVDLGEGVVIESSVWVDAQRLVLDVAVANDAPLGARPVTLDDGSRRLEGVELTIEDVFLDPGTGCAHGGRRPAAGWLLLGLLAGVRRRARAG